MIKEILFVHHTHTDIGYTHPQPVVFELHRRFIDEALDIADDTADWPDESRFRWTCEVTGTTRDWWEHASDHDRDRFLAAVKRGQFEVAGMAWHMTPLMDHAMAIEALRNVHFFRNLGVPVRSAMSTDVNGLPWGVVDALLDHGITGISMAINEHFGHALRPWPRAFRWQSPGGREVLAYNGFIYGVTSDIMLKVPVDMDEARVRVPRWTRMWEESGYPHPFLMHQITNVRYHDNASPQPALPAFIRRWNDSDPEVRLRFVTISEFFNRLRAEPVDRLPAMRGDWTDWWNFGAGSTAHETAQLLEGQRHLDEAMGLRAWHPTEAAARPRLLDQARRSLALYAEHTWGADRSISRPGSPETRTQLLLKLGLASEGASLARMFRRDGMERLAKDAGGEEPSLLVWNPHPFPVRRSLRLPYLPPLAGAPEPPWGMGIETFVPTGPGSHRVQRQDVVMADTPDDHAFWSAPVALQALSYVTIPASDVKIGSDEGLTATKTKLSNGKLTVTFDPKGGVTSLRLDGGEYAGAGPDGLRLGVPVSEGPETGIREAIFARVDLNTPDWHKAWRQDWKAIRETATLVETTPLVARGRAEVTQNFSVRSGDRIDVTYRLAQEDETLEVVALVDKAPVAAPHSIYLPIPTALGDPWTCHFETAGAVLELDREQLPYASRHYITTQRFIRIADGKNEVTVATPDAPLWQVGGFTFGRFREPDGGTTRERPMLLAWLTNNYWNTNFQADQGGQIRFRFFITPSRERTLGESVRDALAAMQPPIAHLYAGYGDVRRSKGTLMVPELGPLMITGMEPVADGIRLTLLNPEDKAHTATIRPGLFQPSRAERTSLSGEPLGELSCDKGAVTVEVGPRAWTSVTIH
jgi:hypothetical protein